MFVSDSPTQQGREKKLSLAFVKIHVEVNKNTCLWNASHTELHVWSSAETLAEHLCRKTQYQTAQTGSAGGFSFCRSHLQISAADPWNSSLESEHLSEIRPHSLQLCCCSFSLFFFWFSDICPFFPASVWHLLNMAVTWINHNVLYTKQFILEAWR